MSDTERVTVSLPNLAVSFLARQPSINEYYVLASQESKEWVHKTCNLDARQKKMVEAGDFAYFVAVVVPDAGKVKHRIFSDWVHWVFAFDDLFDSGELKDDPAVAKKVLDNLLDCMYGKAIPQTRFVAAHTEIWKRMTETATNGVCHRFIRAIENYSTNVLRQVQNCADEEIYEPDELIQVRRETIGVRPLFVFAEFAHELVLSETAITHPLVQEIETLGVDWVLIQNDILSYRQEEEEGVNHNLISACRMHGMTAQEAFDHLGCRLETIYARFDQAIKELPSWGKAVDEEIAKYVEGVKNCVKANLHWSFRTKRYFGVHKDEVRKTSLVDVLKKPPYLSKGRVTRPCEGVLRVGHRAGLEDVPPCSSVRHAGWTCGANPRLVCRRSLIDEDECRTLSVSPGDADGESESDVLAISPRG